MHDVDELSLTHPLAGREQRWKGELVPRGGIAKGLGKALQEHCRYDHADSQLLSGSFMDYAVPHAGDMPAMVSECDESQSCTHNPLGAKGCGEAGTIAAPAADARFIPVFQGALGKHRRPYAAVWTSRLNSIASPGR